MRPGRTAGLLVKGAPAPAGTRLAAKNRLSDLFWTQENLELTYRIVEFSEQNGRDKAVPRW